jgi:hypothetical protein
VGQAAAVGLLALEAAGAFEGEEVLVVEEFRAGFLASVEAADHVVADTVHGEDGPEVFSGAGVSELGTDLAVGYGNLRHGCS